MAVTTNRVRIAFGILAGWIAITVAIGHAGDGQHKELGDLVAFGVGWQFVAASFFLAGAVTVLRWNDIGLNAPASARSLLLLWFPALYLIVFLAVAAALGFPPAIIVGYMLLNTILVGISEELMFRGILFSALRSRLSIWPAIWITTALFGGVHVLNVFFTGQLTGAAVQAGAAFMSGILYIAIRIRTGSLIPGIVFHAAWDFLVFLVVWPRGAEAPPDDLGVWVLIIPILLVLPVFLYGLFLLRKVSHEPGFGT